MTTGHYSRSLLLFGFLVYWGVLRGKCAATISNDSINVTTNATENASAARSFATSHHGTSLVSFEDAEESTMTTDSSSANALRHSQRPRSRLAGGTPRSPDGRIVDASEWPNEANRVVGQETTPERVSRGKKKFADNGLVDQSAAIHATNEPRLQPPSSLVPKLSENTVQRAKPDHSRHENDGYVFESSYPEEHRGNAQYFVGETDDNIDAIRNFNAAGTRKTDVVDVVKKPQGFVMSSSPFHSASASAKHDESFKPAISAHYSRTKEHAPALVSAPSQFVVPPQKRVSNSEPAITWPTDVASHSKIAVDAPPVSYNVGDLDVPANKNEIWKKPPSKLVASSSSGGGIGTGYPKRPHNSVGVEENGGKSSLPAISTAWALASMRPTDTAGAKQWRQPVPVVSSSPTPLLSLLSKKNGLQGKEPFAFDSENSPSATNAGSNGNAVSGVNVAGAIKPFVSWSTRLQKTTTEHSKVSTTPMTTEPQTIIDVDNSTPSIAYVQPKLTKTSTSWTASVREKSDHKADNEDLNPVPKIPAAPNSTISEATVATQTNFSLVGSHRKVNASNDIVQNDVGSMFDREDGDYGADQLPKGPVDFPSSVDDATTLSTRSSTSHSVANSSTVSSTSEATTLDRANNATASESEPQITQSTNKSSDVGTDSALPASDILYGDEDAHQPSNMTTIPTLMLVPFIATESNSSSFQRNQSTPTTSTVTDSNETIVEVSSNQATFAQPANGSFPNVTRVSADIVSSMSVFATAAARPSTDDQLLTKMSTNVFAESTNSSSVAPVPSTTDHPVDAADVAFPSATDFSSELFEKDDDFSSHLETTTASNRSNLTLSSSKTTVSTSSPLATTLVPSSSWLTFTAASTSQSITTTSTLSRITTALTTPMTLASSTTTPRTTTGPPTTSTTKTTAAPSRITTTPSPTTSVTSKPTSTLTYPTTTMGPTSASTPRTTMTLTTLRTTTDSSSTSTFRTSTAPTSPITSVSPRTTTGPTSTFRTTTGSTITTTTGSSSTIKPKIGASNMPGYLKLVFKTTVADICETSTLQENLIQFITQRSLRVQSKNQVMMMIDPEECREPSHSTRSIPVALYVVDEFGGYDKSLVDEMKSLLEDDTIANNTLAIHEIVFRENVPSTSRVIAAIVITSIAAVCFVLLVFLMCAIRSRQKTNYGQKCTPVSADDYNLDNISEYNSVRRRGHSRMSRRSYSNPSFDDPVSPSKTLNLQGLTKAIENRAALDAEFSRIPTIAAKADELPAGVEVKNRYANVIPLPETRVSLDPDDRGGDSADDYINANYVKGFEGADKFYIACQGPLASTIQDFWKMVWNEQTKIIIMLTGLTENGVEKCADYLPPSEVLDCHRLFGDYQVTLKKREVKEKYVISSLQLKNMETNLWREVNHLWYTNWPAQGVPSEQSSIIAFLIEARAYTRNNKGPLVVHCSPGTGRTGTVIAIDICIRDYESSRTVNVPATVSALRRCRAGAVQTKEQYAFIYKVLVLYAKKLNGGTALDSM